MRDAAREAVVECADASSIYEVPPTLHRGGMDTFLVQRPGLTLRDADWTGWNGLRERVRTPSHRLEVALVGKVVTPMEAQCEFITGDGGPGGTMRLGAYPAVLAGGSLVARAYGARQVIARREERHTSSGNDSGVRTR